MNFVSKGFLHKKIDNNNVYIMDYGKVQKIFQKMRSMVVNKVARNYGDLSTLN